MSCLKKKIKKRPCKNKIRSVLADKNAKKYEKIVFKSAPKKYRKFFPENKNSASHLYTVANAH